MSFGGFGKPTTGFGATSTSSPFGQAAQPAQPAGGLFGGGSTTTPAFGQTNPAMASPFGQQQQQPAQTSAFGQPSASTSTGTGLFGAQQQQQPGATTSGFGGFGAAKPAGGLFGTASTNTAAQPAGGGLFGSSTAAQPAAGGGLFGQQSTTAPAGGGLFGQQQQQPAAGTTSGFGAFGTKPAGTGLFGASTTTPAPAAGGLFGAQSTTQPAAGGGLFGVASTNAATQPAGGLFGQQSTAQPAAGGLFGQQSTAAPAAGGLFGQQSTTQPAGGLFAKPQAAAQSQANQIAKTRLADLPENVQKVIEQLDAGIKDQKQIGASIDMSNIGRAIWQTSADVKAASDEQAALAQGLYSLRASLEQLATRVTEQATDLQKLLETWEAAKPIERRSANIRPLAHRDFPQEFFYRVAKSLEERVKRYQRNIMLLNRAVVGLASDSEVLTPQVVAQTIQNNQSAIISLAAQLDQLQLRMNALRTEFTHDYREKTNSMRDPFEVAREEKGVSLLRA